MALFEQFYIKDENGWAILYSHFENVQSLFESLNTQKPDDYQNKKTFDLIKERLSFLITLCTQQAIRINGLHLNATQAMNAVQSLLTVFEDDRMADMLPSRLQEIHKTCVDNIDTVLVSINKYKYSLPLGEKETTLPDDTDLNSIPMLGKHSSIDNLRDAMRILLKQMKEDERSREKVEKLLSAEERLFLDIERASQETIVNFSTASNKAQAGRLQFAHGTLALQGRIDRKALLRIPHSVVQFNALRLSAKVSDGMLPTYFLHKQPFAVFKPIQDAKKRNDALLRTQIKEYRDLALSQKQDAADPLQDPLMHKLFPGVFFLWIPSEDFARRLALRGVKAEISL